MSEMDCDDCIERLYAFLDLELSEKEVAAVRVHLAHCDDCGHNFGFEERFLAYLRECCTSEMAPTKLRERVIARLRAAGPPAT